MPSQRCTATTSRGRDCKLRTCRGQYCLAHMAKEERIRVLKSKNPKAGLGLIAYEEIGYNRRIVQYTGEWLHIYDEDQDGTPYALEVRRGLAIDAARTNSGYGRWANDPRGFVDDQGRRMRPNAKFVYDQRNKAGWLVSTRKIKPNEEILVAYGRAYWRAYRHLMLDNSSISATQDSSSVAAVSNPSTLSPLTAASGESVALQEAIKTAINQDPAYLQSLTALRDPNDLIQAHNGYLFRGDRLVVPAQQSLRTQLIAECHDIPLAGHQGHEKTLARLKERVYWMGMDQEVREYVATCDSCQRNKVEQRNTPGLLQSLSIPSRPGHTIHLDFVMPLPRTKRGHTAYLSVTDKLVKRSVFLPCTAEVTAQQAAQLLFHHWIRHYGLPSTIVSDRDPRFTGQFWQALWAKVGTKLSMTAAYAAAGNGQAENAQRTAGTIIKHFVNFEQDNWDDQLELAEYAMNSSRHASTGLSPFELSLGYTPRSPLDQVIESLHSPTSNVPAVDEFLDRQATWKQAKLAAESAQARQKKYADQSRHAENYAIGDEVLLATEHLKMLEPTQRTQKLAARFIGPFKIKAIINPNAFELELPPQLKIHPVINITRLKRYKRSTRFSTRPDPLPRPPPEAVDANGAPVYEVEKLLAKKFIKRKQYYLVQWKGYPLEDSSWEPSDGLQCPELIQEFDNISQQE